VTLLAVGETLPYLRKLQMKIRGRQITTRIEIMMT
jgi:hypothetical protein